MRVQINPHLLILTGNSLRMACKAIRRGLWLLLTTALLASTLTAQNEKDAPILEPGKPIERELAGDAAHSYRITLATNQFLQVIVEQKGIDVVVRLFAPDGKQLIEVDSPNGTAGPEPVSIVAEMAGTYRLEVRSLEAKAEAGRYQVKVEELRAAQPQDKSRIAAQQAYAEADLLMTEGSAGSRRKAIDKYQEALPLWRAVNDRAKEADTLNNIGLVYNSLGEKQKALDYLNQALPLRRAVGDRSGEATALNNIGMVYNSLGEKQKALDYLNQALPLRPAVGDRSGEAFTLNNIDLVYNSLGENQKALDFYIQASSLFRAVGNRYGEAGTLHNIGAVYYSLGENQKALDFYNQALPLMRAFGDRSGEANTLNNIGMVYYSLGEKQKALDYYSQALPRRLPVKNRQAAKSAVLSQYRYVHFATHGFLNSLHPELSGVVLSMFDEKGTPQDGFLRAHEVFNLKLLAELVVLSACQTGLGKEVKGEGLVSLTRGFMYAGSPRVVVSLWSVSDVGTAELMTRFYKGMLKKGLRPAQALQAAQVSMLNEKRFASPFYWAAFTLQGEWR